MNINNVVSLSNKYIYNNVLDKKATPIKENSTNTTSLMDIKKTPLLFDYKANFARNISFASKKQDKEIAMKYFADFTYLLNSGKYGAGDPEFVDFFKNLSEESQDVQKEFLLKDNNTDTSVFAQSLFSGDVFITNEIIKLLKKSSESTIAKFLIPKTGEVSPFIQATEYDPTLTVAKQLKRLLETLSVENQAKFFYQKIDSIWSINTTILDELVYNGFAQFSKELEDIKEKLIEEHSDIMRMYQEKYVDKNKQLKSNKDEQNEITDKQDTKTEVSKFKIYKNVKTRFSDVGGMFNVKKQIQNDLLNILNNPNVKNSDKPSGIILYGPPGTGKTLLATAIAGEAGVPFISTAGSGFTEIYVGAGAKHVRELYSEARNLAKNSPSKTAIVFIDEADAVAGRRGQSSNKENDHTLNALLSELDGVQSKEENDIKVITIMATNRKDMFDDAFRKGRVDLEFKIDDPRYSEKARKEILEINAKNKPFKDAKEKNKLLTDLAKSSSGMSGAELADVIKRAYRKTLYVGRKKQYITEKDINEAKLETLIGIKNDTEKSDFEQKSVLAHEAGHAINQLIMNKVFENENKKSKMPIQKLDFIVNESRGDAAGLTMMKPSDNHRLTVESLLSTLVVNYGGYSIEESMFDGHTDGVSSDLAHSTNLIINAVTKWGLGQKTKYISCSPDGISFELFKT